MTDQKDWRWSADGLSSALLNGIEPDEAIDALFDTRIIDNQFDDTYVVCAQVRPGRFVTVVTERLDRAVPRTWWIVMARPATRGEIDLWRKQWER